MNENWYCKIVGMEMGPMSFDDLVQLAVRGNLRHDHPVRHGAQGAWVSASTVEGLFSEQDSAAATADVSADFDIDPVEVPVENKSPPKAAKPAKLAKAPKPAKPKVASPRRSTGSWEFRLNGKLILAAACVTGVSLGAWVFLGRQGQRSAHLTEGELVAACRDLHKVLNTARGTSLTAQSLSRFELQFLRQVSAVRFHVGDAPTGSTREKIAAALTELAQMPRSAVDTSNTSAYQEHERTLDELLSQAGASAGN